jgi:hypothetical protein
MLKDARNFLSLDFTNNPALRDVFARFNVGDRATLAVTFQISERSDQAVTGQIVKVEETGEDEAGYTESPEVDQTGQPMNEPSAMQPVMMVMRVGAGAIQ